MKTKTLFAAAALALLPAIASASCGWHTQQQAMTCADGMAYDAESGTCKVVTG